MKLGLQKENLMFIGLVITSLVSLSEGKKNRETESNKKKEIDKAILKRAQMRQDPNASVLTTRKEPGNQHGQQHVLGRVGSSS